MPKDSMTNGRAKWLAYEKPSFAEAGEQSPFLPPAGSPDQFFPIEDKGGILLFRKSFCVKGQRRAEVSATALGVFDLYLNGKRVGRGEAREDAAAFDEMKPGWSDYNKRCLYYSYDITPLLREGENTLLAAVASGWYAGRIAHGIIE